MGGSKKPKSGGGGGGVLMPPQQNLPNTLGSIGSGSLFPQNPQTLGRAATGNGTAAPDWMSGWFAAPWWGQPAPNVGAAIWQQMHPQQYRQMQGLQAKRRAPGQGGAKRNPQPGRSKAQQQVVNRGKTYQGPMGNRGPTGFLNYGPFGGRQR